jgi:hypothetical protein
LSPRKLLVSYWLDFIAPSSKGTGTNWHQWAAFSLTNFLTEFRSCSVCVPPASYVNLETKAWTVAIMRGLTLGGTASARIALAAPHSDETVAELDDRLAAAG